MSNSKTGESLVEDYLISFYIFSSLFSGDFIQGWNLKKKYFAKKYAASKRYVLVDA